MLLAPRNLAALPPLLLFSCMSPATAPNQAIIGTIALSDIRASTGELMGAVRGVYEVRPLDGDGGPILLTIGAPCPSFDIDDLDQNDSSQVFRIEYRRSELPTWTNLGPSDPAHPNIENVTVKCELFDEKI